MREGPKPASVRVPFENETCKLVRYAGLQVCLCVYRQGCLRAYGVSVHVHLSVSLLAIHVGATLCQAHEMGAFSSSSMMA